MFQEVLIDGVRYGVNVQYWRWVKNDGRIKFQEVWFSSVYLANHVRARVLVGRVTEDRLAVWTKMAKRGGRFICIALREGA
jgi:hypothetical protein